MALSHVQLRVFLLLQFLQQLPPLRVKLPDGEVLTVEAPVDESWSRTLERLGA